MAVGFDYLYRFFLLLSLGKTSISEQSPQHFLISVPRGTARTEFTLRSYFSSEVAEKSVSARPGPILEGTLGSRMGPGRAGMAPTSGPGWVRNTVKQSTWQIWTGPPRTRDGTWMGPGQDPGEGQDGTPQRQ